MIPRLESIWSEIRLAKLHQIVAWIALALAAFAVAVALWAGLRSPMQAPSGSQTGTLEADEFAVRDEKGTVRARLSLQGLSVIDEDGRLRVGITTGNTGVPTLALFGSDGKPRAGLSLGGDGGNESVLFYLNGAAGRLRASMSVPENNVPTTLVFYDQSGRQVARVPTAVENESPRNPVGTPTPNRMKKQSRTERSPHH